MDQRMLNYDGISTSESSRPGRRSLQFRSGDEVCFGLSPGLEVQQQRVPSVGRYPTSLVGSGFGGA
jgi:hypothetical protein